MSLGKILIRADASFALGTGHVMRCLALAQAWRAQGGDAVFVMAECLSSMSERLVREGISQETIKCKPGSHRDAHLLCESVCRHTAKWLVVDGYAFHDDYFETLRAVRRKLLRIADNVFSIRAAGVEDILLNQNLHANVASGHYSQTKTELLLGPKYALIRDEFNRCQKRRSETAEIAKKILVTMGGSDPLNLTGPAIDALRELNLPGTQVKVVVGGGNPYLAELKARAGGNCEFVVNTVEMPALISWADMAVATAGSTCWEFCMMGLPAILIDAAENQTPIAVELDRLGIVRHVPLGEATAQRIAFELQKLAGNGCLRTQMWRAGAAQVDGKGALRVVAAMRAQDFRLRPADTGDSRLLFEWTNDPAVRKSSFYSSSITWQEHCRWFAQKLHAPDEMILICEADVGSPVGTVRFHETSPGEFQIGVTISPNWRGKHIASHLLKRAVRHLFENRVAHRVHAFIREENTASSRSFENAGFHFLSCRIIDGVEAFHYCLENKIVSQDFSIPANSCTEAAACT